MRRRAARRRAQPGRRARREAPVREPERGQARERAAARLRGPRPCGEQSTAPVTGATAGGIAHDQQTEGYLIVSGSGTMITGGKIVNGRPRVPRAK